MKSIHFLIFFGLLVGALAQNNATICDDQPNGTLLRDVSNCARYFECTNGVPVSRACESNQQFDYQTSRCQFGSSVQCFRCSSDRFRDIPVPGRVRNFIRCFGSRAKEYVCNEGLVFDSETEMCNRPVVPDRCPISQSAVDRFLLPNRSNCYSFLMCDGFSSSEKYCRSNLHFNSVYNQCDFQSSGQCNNLLKV